MKTKSSVLMYDLYRVIAQAVAAPVVWCSEQDTQSRLYRHSSGLLSWSRKAVPCILNLMPLPKETTSHQSCVEIWLSHYAATLPGSLQIHIRLVEKFEQSNKRLWTLTIATDNSPQHKKKHYSWHLMTDLNQSMILWPLPGVLSTLHDHLCWNLY